MSHDENRSPRFRQVIVSIVVVSLVVATAFAAWWYLSPRPAPQQARSPIAVAAQRAEQLAWRSHLSGVGNLAAVEGVDATSEVAGIITTIAFQPGQAVEKGDLIIQLDATIDRAQLAALKAQEKLAQLRFERQKTLARRDISSKEALDEATAELQRLRAEIEAQEEAIEQKSIKAPFSGRLGIRQVSLGQYVQPGQPLVTLQNLDALMWILRCLSRCIRASQRVRRSPFTSQAIQSNVLKGRSPPSTLRSTPQRATLPCRARWQTQTGDYSRGCLLR